MTRSQVRDVHYYALADIWPCACVMKRMQLAHTRLHVPAWTARLSSATDLLAVMPGTLERLIQWLKMYKTTDGKPANVLASDTPTSAAAASQVALGAALALKFQTTTLIALASQVIAECHESWRALKTRGAGKTGFWLTQ